MPDYLDALFEKAKAKKDAKQPGKPEDAAQKKAVKPEPAKKNPAQIQQAQGKKPWHTEPKPLLGKKNLILEQMRSEEPEKAQSEDKEDEEKKAAKEVMLAKQKIAEIKSTLPPQENINAPQDPESVPEEQKSTAERELETSQKKLVESYGNAKIYELPGQPLLYYWIPVPRPVGAEKTIINTIKEAATRVISITPYKIRDPEQRKNVYYQKVLEILRDSPELNIPKTRFDFYANTVIREMVGYGIIDDLIHDDKLEEIMVIAPNRPVYIFHRKYGMMITNIEFYNDNEIQDLVNRIARQIGRRVDISSPLLDARLPDGSRVNATIPPASVQGSTLTIRKFREDPYTIIDLIKNKTIEAETAAFLWACTDGLGTKPANILISGGTGSGKTTTLNVLATFIPETERIISIEDTAELNLPLKHWIRMEARPPGLEGTGEVTLDILTKNSLRMRPDRIIVGEIRHDEAFSLFTAFNTGHDGSLGTVHANSAQETIVRVTNPPMNVPQVMLSGLDIIVVQHRLHDRKMGTIRRITEIAQVTGALEGKPKTEAVYLRDPVTDSLKRTKAQINYAQKLQELAGMSKKDFDDEVKDRAAYLEKLVKENRRSMKEISEAVKQYSMKKK